MSYAYSSQGAPQLLFFPIETQGHMALQFPMRKVCNMSQSHFNSMTTKLLFLTMFAAVAMIVGPAQAGEVPLSPEGQVYLNQLLDEGAFVVSPERRFEFGEFSFITAPPGGPGPEAEDIRITLSESANSVDLVFSILPPSRMLGGNAPDNWWDIALSYRAEVLNPELEMFNGHTVSLGGFAIGDGYVILQETLSDENDSSIGILSVYDDPIGFGTKPVDSMTFTPTHDIVYASKDLAVVGGTQENGGAFLSHFEQTFHTEPIPEPSGMALLILGCAGLGTIGWYSRRQVC